jgi:cbb3-type cytochrome oxidase subunit 3
MYGLGIQEYVVLAIPILFVLTIYIAVRAHRRYQADKNRDHEPQAPH